MKSTKPLELLILKLQDPERSIRWASATALGKIDSDRAIEPLISRLEDTDPIVRWCSAEALGNIGNEKEIASTNQKKIFNQYYRRVLSTNKCEILYFKMYIAI